MSHSVSYPQSFEDGEENMEESPCPRPKVPAIASYRKADEKSETGSEFKITPRMNFDTPREDEESDESFIFTRGDSDVSSNSYELFDWCNEFNKIINGTHKDIFKPVSSLNVKKIDLKSCESIDPVSKYECLSTYMSIKADIIRKAQTKNISPVADPVPKPKKRVLGRKRNSCSSNKLILDTSPIQHSNTNAKGEFN